MIKSFIENKWVKAVAFLIFFSTLMIAYQIGRKDGASKARKSPAQQTVVNKD
ncbi:hypothetical protein [Pedobacter changchengzhani]|uniref:hypothetical protein n=1 Tax=Pedobacter changchengzhani TaxID=2529274 RepID=UPI0014045944|nr:hypothetical protein [Pedobacter changchengzhani]